MKRLSKSLLLCIAIILTSPLWMLVTLFVAFGKGDQLFLGSGQLLSLVPGLSGVFLRRGFYVMTLESCARDVFVEFGTWFSHRQSRVGSSVYIGGRCIIGMVEIGNNVLIGSNVDVLSGKDQHQFVNSDLPINEQGGRFEKIFIGEDCWIGNSSVIIADVESRSVIGAGSVVVKAIPESSIAVGNPARAIRSRD